MRFTSDMLISDALKAHPEAVGVFEGHDLACPACLAADMETIASVASMHDIDVEELLRALNSLPEGED